MISRRGFIHALIASSQLGVLAKLGIEEHTISRFKYTESTDPNSFGIRCLLEFEFEGHRFWYGAVYDEINPDFATKQQRFDDITKMWAKTWTPAKIEARRQHDRTT